jgi:hypothetical protein
MSKEALVLVLIWVVGISTFVLFIPKNSRRRFIFAYLSCQSITWLNYLILLQLNFLSFPIREFPIATDILFTTASFFYPLIFAFYKHYELKVENLSRLLYLFIWISGITFFDKMIELYTNLLSYLNYTWYWSWLDFFCLFALSHVIYQWFFIDNDLFQKDRETTI